MATFSKVLIIKAIQKCKFCCEAETETAELQALGELQCLWTGSHIWCEAETAELQALGELQCLWTRSHIWCELYIRVMYSDLLV